MKNIIFTGNWIKEIIVMFHNYNLKYAEAEGFEPPGRETQLISSQSRYDHFGTLPGAGPVTSRESVPHIKYNLPN